MSRRFYQLVLLAAGGFVLWGLFVEGPGSDRARSPKRGAVEDPLAAEPPVAREKPVPRRPSALEKGVKRQLEARVRGELRSDHVVKTDGRVLRGRILAESPTSVRLLRSFGSTGQMQMDLPRSEVREVVRNSSEPPAVSFRDVRFHLEFPDLKFTRRPPFTIVSDQDFFRVADAVALLEALNADLSRAFGPLFTRPERDDGIQLLFFSRAKQFKEYRKRHAPEIGFASGFYSRSKDRLVVFDQKTSKWARQATREVNKMKAVHRRKAVRHGDLAGLERWHDSVTGRIHADAARANRAILRHEGAHQLFFNYGVHSEHVAEHPWLIEGLASFCEDRFGGEDGGRADDARDRKRRASFAALVNFESQTDFGGRSDSGRGGGLGPNADVVGDAYAQSWFLVQHLMQNHRDAFFEYIRFVRDPANRRELRRASRFELLSGFLGRAPRKLERELQRAHAEL